MAVEAAARKKRAELTNFIFIWVWVSWTINCLDCDKIGGRLRAKKHGEEQKSCVISQQISAWREAVARAVAPSSTEEKNTSATFL